MVVATSIGPVLLKEYRSDWTPARVEHTHSILMHLETTSSPAPRVIRREDGGTWTQVSGATYALFSFAAGRNLSMDRLRRKDRLRAVGVAGRVLGRLHRDLHGFVPGGEHHLGFTSLDGPERIPLAWYVDRLSEYADAALPGPLAAFSSRADELARRLAALDRDLASAALPRVVIHGDFGLHNLLFESTQVATPVDFELARIEHRLTDVLMTVSRFGSGHVSWDLPAIEAFLADYVAEAPAVTSAELRLLPSLWVVDRLRSAIRAVDNVQHGGDERHVAAAARRLREADWLASGPAPVHHVRDVLASLSSASMSR